MLVAWVFIGGSLTFVIAVFANDFAQQVRRWYNTRRHKRRHDQYRGQRVTFRVLRGYEQEKNEQNREE